MRKFLFIFLLVAVGVYLWENNYPQDMYGKLMERVKEMGVYHSVLSKFDAYLEEPAGGEDSRVPDETPQSSDPLPAEPAERRPYMNFQGVMREDGTLYAVINNVLYKKNDFVRDYRLVEVESSYIVIQGRTRQFRYNLN